MLKGKSEKTQSTYLICLNKHLLPWFQDAMIGDILPNDLLAYKETREEQGASQVPIEIELYLVRLKGEPKVIATFLAYLGLKVSDGLYIKWSSFDFKSEKGPFIRLFQKKTGKLLRIPMHPNLLDSIASIPQGIGDVRLFRMKKSGFHYHWDRARKKAGFEWLRVHDLRHFFGSYLASHGERREVIAKLIGHANMNSTALYARFDETRCLSPSMLLLFAKRPQIKKRGAETNNCKGFIFLRQETSFPPKVEEPMLCSKWERNWRIALKRWWRNSLDRSWNC